MIADVKIRKIVEPPRKSFNNYVKNGLKWKIKKKIIEVE